MAIIIVNSRLLSKGVNGMTIAPFIIVRNERIKNNKRIINHEKIHIKQQIEMLWLPFFIWYGIEYLFKGYRNISFEREAYDNDDDLNYILSRKYYAWFKRIKK